MVSYSEAGVDVEKKERTLLDIRDMVKGTFTSDVVGAETTFKYGGTISLKRFMQLQDPVMVVSTDGVGTKMIVAEMMKKYGTVGKDIVNHSVNDILTSGAKPLFFVDYVASSKLDSDIVKEIVKGIAEQCKKLGIILAGGETAEMPGVYHDGKYELSGTITGIVDREKLIDGSTIEEGDILIGLSSSGLHTNGYSLARKIFFEDNNYGVNDNINELGKLGDVLLEPHREYATSVLPIIDKKLVKGVGHITGGGFAGNIPRILPEGLGAVVKIGSWDVLPVFRIMKQLGNVSQKDMLRTFNMGIGMVLVVNRNDKDEVIKMLFNEKSFVIGEVVAGKGVRYESI